MWTCLFELIKLSLNTKVKFFFQLYRHSNLYCYYTLHCISDYLQKNNLRYPNFLKCDSLSHLVHVHDTHNVCNDLKEIFISLVILLSSLFVYHYLFYDVYRFLYYRCFGSLPIYIVL